MPTGAPHAGRVAGHRRGGPDRARELRGAEEAARDANGHAGSDHPDTGVTPPRVDRVITAIVSSSPADVHAIDETARAVADVDGVRECNSCAGDVDLIAIVAVRDHERVASVVNRHHQQAARCAPHRHAHAFKAYSSADVDAGSAIGE